MKLSTGIVQAYERQWSMINSFTIQINLSAALQEIVGSFTDDINLNIVSATTPDFTNDPIEAYIGGKWYIANGKDQLYRFTITFRDQNQMKLYRTFLKIYDYTKYNYFDDSKMSIIYNKDADWANESELQIVEFNGVLIEAVSNLSFSNDTENQIAEFTVSFKCNETNINY